MKIFLIICNNFVKVLMDMRNIQKIRFTLLN